MTKDTLAIYGTSEKKIVLEFRNNNVAQSSATFDIQYAEEMITKLDAAINFVENLDNESE